MINVLGVEYIILMTENNLNYFVENPDIGGLCNFEEKVIYINGQKLSKNEIKITIIHELIHAFLYESGLNANSWAENEEIVDWIAMQFSKIRKEIEKIERTDLWE